MLSIQYYPFGCQNGQQNRQHSRLRIAGSAIPMLSVHAVHFALQSSFQAQYSTTHHGRGSCTSYTAQASIFNSELPELTTQHSGRPLLFRQGRTPPSMTVHLQACRQRALASTALRLAREALPPR